MFVVSQVCYIVINVSVDIVLLEIFGRHTVVLNNVIGPKMLRNKSMLKSVH